MSILYHVYFAFNFVYLYAITLPSNFVKWKNNINLLLINENYHYVLEESCPPVPPTNASKVVSKEYNRCVIANNKARCYFLVAMDEVLRTKHEVFETASEIMESL